MDNQILKSIRNNPVTIGVVMGMTIISISANLIGTSAIQSLGLSPATISYRSLFTIVTYAFLHADIVHWFFNTCWIVAFGLLLEPRIGSFRTGLLMLMGTLALSISMVVFDEPSPALVMGCSGAAYSLLAAYALILCKTFNTLATWEKVIGLIIVLLPTLGLISSMTHPIGRGELLSTAVGVIVMFVYVSLTREIIEIKHKC